MGTVKYTGPVASFHCPTEATIRSLKVHFSPKQLGSGDPSPENVRPIEGWDGVISYKSGKNLAVKPSKFFRGYGVKAYNDAEADLRETATGFICTPKNGNSGYSILIGYVHAGQTYTLSFTKTGSCARWGYSIFAKENVGTAIGESYDGLRLFNSGWLYSWNTPVVITPTISGFLYLEGHQNSSTITEYEFSNIQLELGSTVTLYELYHGSTTNYEFGVLGKNKFPAADGAESDCFLAANTPYVLSATSASEGYFRGYYEDGTNTGIIWINQTRDGDRRSTVITPEKNIIKGFFFVASGMSECQIELGSTATTYEPYNPNKTVYGGWVDLISGEVQETHGLKTFNGSEQQWVWTQSNNGIPYIAIDSMKSGTWYSDSYTICDTAIKVNTSSSGALQCLIGYNNKRIYFYNTTTVIPNISNLDDFTSWLSTNNITITYPLETPNTYYLAPTSMQTFLSTNNIWSNADYVEVEYDLHETQNILARKQFIVANQPHVVKPAAAPLQNFVTDMAAPLKECKVYFSPIQDTSNGAPSPDNICPISGWNNINIYTTGKNLIDENYLINANNYPNAGNYGYHYTDDIQLIPNTRYRFVWYNYDNTVLSEFGVTSINLFVQGASEYIVNNADYRQYSSGFLTPSTGIIRFGIYHPSSLQRQDILNAIFNNGKLLLQIGTNDENYEPYNGTTIPITFPSEAGTIYGGYVDLITGEVVETWHKIVADGVNVKCNSSYMNDTVIAAGIVYLNPVGKSRATSTDVTAIADTLPVYTQSYISWNPGVAQKPYATCTNAGNQYIVFVLANRSDHPEVTDATTCKAFVNEWLQNNPTTIVYELATPIHYQLTPQQLKTLRGTNNIWSNSNGDITVQFWKH